jgi:hypothetical protein
MASYIYKCGNLLFFSQNSTSSILFYFFLSQNKICVLKIKTEKKRNKRNKIKTKIENKNKEEMEKCNLKSKKAGGNPFGLASNSAQDPPDTSLPKREALPQPSFFTVRRPRQIGQ